MKAARQSCGCTFVIGDIERWVELCPPHRAEADATHARWNAEHRASTPLPPARTNVAARTVTRIRRAA